MDERGQAVAWREAENLRPLTELAPSFTTLPLVFPHPEGWSLFNPSVASGPDGLTAIVRSSNYTVDHLARYAIRDGGAVVRTRNYLAHLRPDGTVREVSVIDDGAVRTEPPLFPVAGFEDCRLLWRDGAWWAAATRRDAAPGGVCQMVALRLEGARVVELIPLSDGVSRHEKNWMPIIGAGPLPAFVDTIAPTVVRQVNPATRQVTTLSRRQAPAWTHSLRGGGQVLPAANGWLAVAHEPVSFQGGARVYNHRWVWFDAGWRLRQASPPFFLRERGIEFAAGLAQQESDLLVSFGVWDREAWLGRVALAEVLAMMEPLAHAAARPAVTSPDLGITLATGRPRIVATTLAGYAAEGIDEALRSVVDWVDWCLLIDTGMGDDTLHLAREIAGSKLVVREFPWRDDFAAVRNYALAAAHELGADWALTLDTDEWIELRGLDIHSALRETTADTLHVQHADGTYGKERLFRLPARGAWEGPTHEAYARGGVVATLPSIVFDELGKDADQYRRKAERDIAILERHIAQYPESPRWHYYLGDSLAGLQRHAAAVAAFRTCAELRGWDEESAWACYRAAESLLALGRPVEAIEACAAGMARHAGLGELPWLAAYAAWQADRPEQAVHWARLSVLLGHFMGSGATVSRLGFRHPPALWEGPFDVLRFALRRIGDDAGADEAERLYAEAKAAREQHEG
ncbi:MAG: hypothetical protein KC442_01465 [Thermomicrobiales bacterium]|nr:hypothetical protein [Thermomicrobiales bacterium]